MKLQQQIQQNSNLAQPTKVNNQVSQNSILQAYKDKTLQHKSNEEEELLQGKFDTAQLQAVQQESSQKEENNTGLPDNLKKGIENLSGYSMDDVKVHYNSSQPATLQAHAYAQGTDIHIAPGQEQYLPHEAWHVVQQKQGRVKPTMQMKGGVNVNNDIGLEREADLMGEKTIRNHDQGVIAQNKSQVPTSEPYSTTQLLKRAMTDDESNIYDRNEMFTGHDMDDEGVSTARPKENPKEGSLEYIKSELIRTPGCKISFAFMVRTPNNIKDKLKGEDGHAAIQLYVHGSDAKIQVGLGGKGVIAKEHFAETYSRDDDKYTMTVYHSEITHEKAHNVIRKLESDAGNGHQYSRIAHPLVGSINCATWAISVARVAGFSFPLAYILGSNPLFLGMSLKQSMWKRKEYTKAQPNGKEIDIDQELEEQISSIK